MQTALTYHLDKSGYSKENIQNANAALTLIMMGAFAGKKTGEIIAESAAKGLARFGKWRAPANEFIDVEAPIIAHTEVPTIFDV